MASAGRVGWRWKSRLGARSTPPEYDEKVDGEHRRKGREGLNTILPDRSLELRAKLKGEMVQGLKDEMVHGDPPTKPARERRPYSSLRHQRRSALVSPERFPK